ncbi:MAG: hypothetical protein L0216_07160 [Planctomycetales bacterium]|nr:hypothetical protein [Planctomycetales bacterium]
MPARRPAAFASSGKGWLAYPSAIFFAAALASSRRPFCALAASGMRLRVSFAAVAKSPESCAARMSVKSFFSPSAVAGWAGAAGAAGEAGEEPPGEAAAPDESPALPPQPGPQRASATVVTRRGRLGSGGQ